MSEEEKYRFKTMTKGRYYEDEGIQRVWVKLNKSVIDFKRELVSNWRRATQLDYIGLLVLVLAVIYFIQKIYHLTQR